MSMTNALPEPATPRQAVETLPPPFAPGQGFVTPSTTEHIRHKLWDLWGRS